MDRPAPDRHGAARVAALVLAAGALAVLCMHGASMRAAAMGGVMAGVALLAVAVRRATEPPPALSAAAPRGRLWLEVAWLVAVLAASAWEGLHFHGMASPPDLPGWSELRWLSADWSRQLGLGDAPYRVFNPIVYGALPLLVVLPSTGGRHLGCGPGHRALRVAAIVAALPLLVVVGKLLAGDVAERAALLGQSILGNTLQNGPFEEFLFRGLLQTRLVLLLGVPWGLLLSSLAFGVWHLGLDLAMAGGGGVLPALALGVALQGSIGLLLGYVFHRTRNLLAPSLAHVAINVAGEMAMLD